MRITICNFVGLNLTSRYMIVLPPKLILGCQLAAQTLRSHPYRPLEIPYIKLKAGAYPGDRTT